MVAKGLQRKKTTGNLYWEPLQGGSVNYLALNHALNSYCLRRINIFFLKIKDNCVFVGHFIYFRVVGRVQEPLPAPYG